MRGFIRIQFKRYFLLRVYHSWDIFSLAFNICATGNASVLETPTLLSYSVQLMSLTTSCLWLFICLKLWSKVLFFDDQVTVWSPDHQFLVKKSPTSLFHSHVSPFLPPLCSSSLSSSIVCFLFFLCTLTPPSSSFYLVLFLSSLLLLLLLFLVYNVPCLYFNGMCSGEAPQSSITQPPERCLERSQSNFNP